MDIENQTKGKNAVLLAAVAVVLSAAVTGGVVYAAAFKRDTSTKNDLQAQVDEVKAKVAAIPTATPSLSATPALDANLYTNSTYKYSLETPKGWYVDKSGADEGFLADRSGLLVGGSVTWSNYAFPDTQYVDSSTGSMKVNDDFQHVYLQVLHKTDSSQSLHEFLGAYNGNIVDNSPVSFTTASGVKGEKWVETIKDVNGSLGYNHYVFQNGEYVYMLNVTNLGHTAATAAAQNATVDAMAASFSVVE